MARMCEGMSGREISKLGVAWQAATYASEDGVLTQEMVLDKCRQSAQQHKQKVNASFLIIQLNCFKMISQYQFLDGLVVRT